MAQTNHIEKVAIVGAGGNIGKHFVEELLKTGKHTITVIARPESTSTPPADVKVVKASYDDEEALVSALQGQQFFIITLGVLAPPDSHTKLVKAAIKAGVPYIMPNVYGGDMKNENFRSDPLWGAAVTERFTEIESLGGTFIAMVCGFWYEWSLALGEPWFGFDFKEKKVVFFDDGKTRINVSTWRQCGRALAALLSLPESGASPAVADWKNNFFYLSSFRVSQRDMLDSIHRVTGSTDKDWEITYEPSAERYKNGIETMKKGDRRGFARALYSRTFFPNGGGDYESNRELVNDLLGLPKEELDQATKTALDMVESGWNPFG